MALTDAKFGLQSPLTRRINSLTELACSCWYIPIVPVTGVSVIVFWVRRRLLHLVCIQKFLSEVRAKRDEARKLISAGIDLANRKELKSSPWFTTLF